MAKSKEQKQQEALERKQAMFPEKLAENVKYNPGGTYYEDFKRKYVGDYADKRMQEANVAFARYLKEAHLNRKGEIVHVDSKGVRHEGIILGKNRPHCSDNYSIHQHLNEL